MPPTGNPGVWGTAGKPTPKGGRKYYTFRRAPQDAGYAPGDILKLLAGQEARFAKDLGWYAAPARAGARTGGGAGAGAATSKALTDEEMIAKYQSMLTGQQRGVLDALLGDRERQRNAQLQSLAGFGAALQGYSHDLWGQTNSAYQNAAAAQQSMAQGLGGQVGSGIAGARAQQAALAGALGQGEGGYGDMPTAEAGAAQVASEGGKDTGGMMGAVGTAWGGYGATRPEYIGFMTGQNQMQIMREAMEGDRDLQSEFLKLGMENPVTAFDMFAKMQENKRQNISSSLAQQTLRTNIAMQKAKLKQDWAEARMRAQGQAAKLAVDKRYKEAQNRIDQQNADASTTRAGASVTSANASATRAETAQAKAEWDRTHPGQRGTPAKYATGNFQQKVASAMYNAHNLFDDSGQAKAAGRTEYAFRILWPQMEAYIPKAQQARAKNLLRTRLRASANMYKPKPSSGGGGGGEDW